METKKIEDCPAFASDHGETVWELIGNVASKPDTKHSFALCEIEPNSSSQPHYHPICEESYFILSGKAKMVIDGEEQILEPGHTVLISPNQTHQIFNIDETPLKFAAICVPPWTPECSVFVDE